MDWGDGTLANAEIEEWHHKTNKLLHIVYCKEINKMVAAQEIEGKAMQASILKSSSTIQSEVERTAELLFNFGDLLDRLDNKVYAVSMVEDISKAADPTQAPPMVSSLANSIWEKNEKLSYLCLRLEGIINRIDL